MSSIVAVMVVPAEGDPGGLLAPGACGYPPAFAAKLFEDSGWSPRWYAAPIGRPQDLALFAAVALPLWLDGALVPEGWDRARRVVHGALGVREREVFAPVLHAFAPSEIDGDHREGWELCLWLAVELVRAGLAARVVRLARVDGRLVESR